jgi:acyl carrier protein
MVISSRTPEGDPAACPVCGEFVCIEPSVYFSDAPCPSCGSLLWFVRLGEQNLLVQPTDAARRKTLIGILAELTGVSESQLNSEPESLERLELDSMDLIDLIMELETESGGLNY